MDAISLAGEFCVDLVNLHCFQVLTLLVEKTNEQRIQNADRLRVSDGASDDE